jgi:two-component system, NtrC family, sensor kinase
VPKNGQIGWFRLRLSVDSAVNQQMVLMIQQSSASEVYLNGLLIHQFGTLSTTPREIKAFNPLEKPVSFPFKKDSRQVLAVRYALQPQVLYANHFGSQNKILAIVLISTEKAMDRYSKSSNFNNVWNSFAIGLNIILCVLYFAFYLYYPKQRANLYFSIYCLFALMINAFSMYWHDMNQVDGLYLIKNLDLSVGVISSLFLLTAIYRLFEQKIDVFYVGLLLLGLVSILMAFGVYNWGWLVYSFPFNANLGLENIVKKRCG